MTPRSRRRRPMPVNPSVAVLTMGCARNEVDSEELAGRLESHGWSMAADPEDADVVLVNTCGFVEAAKKDSIDTLLAAADLKDGRKTRAVVAVGCLAERYGAELAAALPEADAILGFDDYADISERLTAAMHGRKHVPHAPRDRRALLPLTPVDRQAAAEGVAVPGHAGDATGEPTLSAVEELAAAAAALGTVPDLEPGTAPASGPRPLRRRLEGGPVSPLKLASGCDRRCTFCAIPSFRGSFLSRRPGEILTEAAWLASQGVKELVLVSENSTSYGKDLGELRLLELLMPQLAAVPGIERVRVNYLQPAEMRPSLVEVIATTPGVAPYFDLSFQHASGPVLRRMRRFGDADSFLGLVAQIRSHAPDAGIRTNIIVGFPGETEADLAELERFLIGARLDTVGVFGYSDEDGTEAVGFDGKVDEAEIRDRVERLTSLVEELTAARAEDRIGERVEVLVESDDPFRYPGAETWGEACAEGRGAHQAPEVDGNVVLVAGHAGTEPAVGEIVSAKVVGTDGVDLVAVVTG